MTFVREMPLVEFGDDGMKFQFLELTRVWDHPSLGERQSRRRKRKGRRRAQAPVGFGVWG